MLTFVYDHAPTNPILQIIKIEDDQKSGFFSPTGKIHVTLADEKFHHRCRLSSKLRQQFESDDFLPSNVFGHTFLHENGVIQLKRTKIIKTPGSQPIVTILGYEVVSFSEEILSPESKPL